MLNELLYQVESYLNGKCTLKDLEGWLLSNLQAILDSSDEKAVSLADELDADLVELGEGLIDETTLRGRLESRIKSMETLSFSFPETERSETIRAEANEKTLTIKWQEPKPVEVLHLDLVFA